MSYYQDLSYYEYFNNTDDSLNIGWLSIDNEYPKGTTPQEAIEKIRELTQKPVNICRGTHRCEFCDTNPKMGNGEIRVPAPDVIFASPVLILHYIEEHEYKPPEAFIQALMYDRPKNT